ncbi:MAG: arylesterase, partial [Gammaproteobacteria bacterium]
YYLIIFSFTNIIIAEEETLLILGDSISAGYGINQKDNWVSVLQSKFDNDGTSIKLINSSVSGDTTSGGLQRLRRDLQKFDPDYVLIELGGNDALRGYPIKRIKDNLQTMIALIKSNNSKALLMQIRIPPNYGQKYTLAFERIYLELASSEEIYFLPFMLENVGLNPDLMQPDGIHPNAKAQPLIAKDMKKNLDSLLLFK